MKLEAKKIYTCPYCGKSYKGLGLKGHIWAKHTEQGRFTRLKNAKKYGFQKGGKTWNKNLTKNNDERVKKGSKNLNNYFKTHSGTFTGKKHSVESKEKISKSLQKNPNGGGLRQGSGRGKKGWYKGYFCDSSWELAFVIYNLDHQVKFIRNTIKYEYEYKGKKHFYIPDFIIDGKFIEIKGYFTESFEEKCKQFPYPLQIIGKVEIQKYLDYVIQKYGKNFIEKYEV